MKDIEAWVLASGAFSIGFVHSLSPAHWLPLAAIARARNWSKPKMLLGSIFASLGHIIVTVSVGLSIVYLGQKGFERFGITEESIETASGFFLMTIGLLYAFWFYRKHGSCKGHGHHGPRFQKGNAFGFLFLTGVVPCLAILPVFASALGMSSMELALIGGSFSLGVWIAVFGAAALSLIGFRKIDHPFIEHHSDTIAGLMMALVGLGLVFFHQVVGH